jgi:hypothetical protein
MIPQSRAEFDSGIEQRLVRDLELDLEVLRPLRPVQVVAHQQHQVELELLLHARDLRGHLVLLRFAGAEVAEHAELQRSVLVRHRQRNSRWTRRGLNRLRRRCICECRRPGRDSQRDGDRRRLNQ